ncbi:Zn-dependent hydrolase [Phreatobacter aquaticus]|uniref:Zn-dependent hydrolase n=1 Tax=Phreatobacter aquaticus TaxID=2570229 RepID=A0A4D7QHJ8_9HYPH|nr:Zn-dependent hydrolase [Phreatobacter aquaticus]QCK85163.1 Zn-dependent hydrolase [Phreatobacter aquaticus]
MPGSRGIDGVRLLGRLQALGAVGRGPDGALTRLAGSDADKHGRDLVSGWMREAGLRVEVDQVGNLFGTLDGSDAAADPVMVGSHIDSVINAGIYDGCYGVLAGLEVAQRFAETGAGLARPLTIAAFTDEEGVRFQPDMLGSLVHAGGLSVEAALASVGTDGATLGDELARIGYAGAMVPGTIRPSAYLELHIEQGPVLEHEGVRIGAVENLQGISWQRVTIEGDANHAGTTPIRMRRDAGLAAARVVTFLRDHVDASNAPTVATVGTMRFEPDAINVIPSRATFTVDLRDPDEDRLKAAEAALAAYLDRLARQDGVTVSTERLARFDPVIFDEGLVRRIEQAARARGLSCRRMTSGAGHDAQMMARLAPSAMIFVPSVGGISHNPKEFTEPADLVAGAEVLMDVVAELCGG